MKLTFIKSLAAATVATIAFCPVSFAHGGGDDSPARTQQHYGNTATLGGGVVKTYVVLGDKKDEATNHKPPIALGAEIPLASLNSLPSDTTALIIDFPIQARQTPFQYMMIDWNPQGHPPAGIYDKPHFDFHFYIQDWDEVMAIAPGSCSGLACDAYERAIKPVPAAFVPSGYIDVGSVVPYMGNHLIDATSPEFNGKPFTRTWLYGAYDGQVTFYEPMITLQSLISEPNQCTSIKQPEQYADSGYYPTKYCTEYDRDNSVYRIFVKDFVYRIAPPRAVPAQK